MRRTSRRSESPLRIAAVISAWTRSRRDTGVGYLGRRTPVGPQGWRSGSWMDPGGSAGLRSGVLLALGFLALALHGGLLVVLASASLGEDATLLDLLVEAAQGALERLVLSHSDFSQSVFTSSDQRIHRARGSRSTGPERAPLRVPRRSRRSLPEA